MTKDEIIQFWINTSEENLATMHRLYLNKEYDWCLFIGHLGLEKLLKAYYVKIKDENFPYSHNLIFLANKSELELTEKQKDLLIEVTSFNIEARYVDYKRRFRDKCTPQFTEKYVKNIDDFYKWLMKKF